MTSGAAALSIFGEQPKEVLHSTIYSCYTNFEGRQEQFKDIYPDDAERRFKVYALCGLALAEAANEGVGVIVLEN